MYSHISFLITEQLAPWVNQSGMKHSSIVPRVDMLSEKAGHVKKDNAEAYMAREFMKTCLVSSPVLDEVHLTMMI